MNYENLKEKIRKVQELLDQYKQKFNIESNELAVNDLMKIFEPEPQAAEIEEVVPQYVIEMDDNMEIMNVELQYIVKRGNNEYVVPREDEFEEANEYEEQEDSYNIIRGNNVGERLGAELFKEMYKVVAENLDYKLKGFEIKKEVEDVVNELKRAYREDEELKEVKEDKGLNKIKKVEYELDPNGNKYKGVIIAESCDKQEIKIIFYKPREKLDDIIKLQEKLKKGISLKIQKLKKRSNL